MASFADRLKELRINMGVGQKEVGALIDVSDSSIRKYESGERTPDPNALIKLATYFDVTVDYLLGRTDQPNKEFINEPKKPKDLLKFLEQSEVMFDGVPLTEEDKEKVRKALELAFWDAKQQNKRKKSQ